ncbi:MAG: hypothetical protein HZB31_11960 [Nitrospirae bacterium]|nr:hypothetical protein [Nitrospirota bacterium]
MNPLVLHARNIEKPKSEYANMQVLQLVNGPNQVDLNGDGKKDIVFLSWRENYNAHGFSLFTFYIDYPNDLEPEKHWHLVTFPDEKGLPLKNGVATMEGADCFLQDIRVLRSASQKKMPIVLIMGKREFGESYADSESVEFIVYDLKHNKEGGLGEPTFHFEPKKTIKGKKKYCDINAAFAEELGIGNYQKK